MSGHVFVCQVYRYCISIRICNEFCVAFFRHCIIPIDRVIYMLNGFLQETVLSMECIHGSSMFRNFLCCYVRYDFHITTTIGSSLLLVVCKRAHVLFIYFICDCMRTVVFNTYCVVFLLCFSSFGVPCPICFPFLWIDLLRLPLRYSLMFIF